MTRPFTPTGDLNRPFHISTPAAPATAPATNPAFVTRTPRKTAARGTRITGAQKL